LRLLYDTCKRLFIDKTIFTLIYAIMKITTDRLILREFTLQDTDRILEITKEDFILKWMPDWAMNREELAGLLNWYISCYAEPENMRTMLAITEKSTSQVIGMIGCGHKAEVNDEVEMAYFISEKYAGKGYMTEAASAFSKWVLENKKIEYLMAIVEPDNIPSEKIIKKCGFKKIRKIKIVNSGETEPKEFLYYRLYR